MRTPALKNHVGGVRACARLHAHTHTHTHTHTYTHMHTRTHTHTHTHTNTHMRTLSLTHIHKQPPPQTDTPKHTHMHTNTHTRNHLGFNDDFEERSPILSFRLTAALSKACVQFCMYTRNFKSFLKSDLEIYGFYRYEESISHWYK